MAVVTLADYDTINRPQHRYLRQCPSYEQIFPSLWATYNPNVPSGPEKLRRTAFRFILVLQAIYLLLSMNGFPLSPSALAWTISSLLFFFFVAWNLHLIVKMEGSRTVFGKRFSRPWFDGFLWGLVAAYAALLCWRVWTFGTWSYGAGTTWVLLDLAIFGVAWVSTWSESGIALACDDQV